MGWLFGKKKIMPKVPFPDGMDDDVLQFPSSLGSERVIEPARLKEAVGMTKPMSMDKPLPMPRPEMPLPPRPEFRRTPIEPLNSQPFFVKVGVYQQLLGEMESLRTDLNHLVTVNNHLKTAEYNEESNFGKLRKDVKAIHDKLLAVDKTLFKGE